MCCVSKLRVFGLSCISVFILSGCYTVLSNPYSVQTKKDVDSDYQNSPAFEYYENDNNNDLDDFYRYPGSTGGYGVYNGGYGYGYPSNGYGNAYGAGYYGGYNGYGGYTPYSYGYDPYYSNNNNYIPPGYELISNRELDEIRASIIELRNKPVVIDPKSEQEATDLRQDVWLRRTKPHMRRAPVVGQERTSSYIPSSTPSASVSPSSTGRPASSKSAPAPKSNSEKSSDQPKKKRR